MRISSVPILVLFVFGNIFSQTNDLNSLKWILGVWKIENSTTTVIEKWDKVSETTFEGSSITINNSTLDTLFSESLRILKMEGFVYYLAKVSHNEFPIAFRLVWLDDSKVVFENSGHDFPQRIVYSKNGTDTLNTTVTGIKNSEENKIIFNFRRK